MDDLLNKYLTRLTPYQQELVRLMAKMSYKISIKHGNFIGRLFSQTTWVFYQKLDDIGTVKIEIKQGNITALTLVAMATRNAWPKFYFKGAQLEVLCLEILKKIANNQQP